MLIFNCPEGLKGHKNTLNVLCMYISLSINMNKTKMIVFNTTQAWVIKSEQKLFLRKKVKQSKMFKITVEYPATMNIKIKSSTKP